MAIVPAVLVATMLVLAFAGGFSGLGDLAQALAGPSVGLQAPAAAAQPVPRRLLAAIAAPAAPASRRGTPALRSGTRAGTGSLPTASTPAAGRGGSVALRAPVHHGSSPVRRGHPAAGPTPHPTVIDGIVSAGSSAASSVPGPAGSVATKALQTAGSTVDKILPPPPPAIR